MPAATTPIAWAEPTAGIRLARADWLDAASSLAPGSIDLFYADPPFNTGAVHKGEAGAFDDRWPSPDDFLGWLGRRLETTIPLLKPTGSLLLHLDWRTSHRARCLLDDLLGPDRFVNHLVWTYGLGGSSPRRFARKHDDILYYCIDPDRYWFEPPMIPATSRRMRGQLKKATDVLDIPSLNNQAKERIGWPTQKPLQLLELLIGACCPPGGTVLDPCCGSGTTLVAAVNQGRTAIGCDIDGDAIGVTTNRLKNR
ncbi:MAG: site-specific DNA-methyltransferase [Phycisphaeraceae bacterium]|nr:site-specific DNA-methyltransferase [Phycisphaeraceae bacterium]MCB9848709.1 site-specific DNA-methyltransferase [Phycisphaeraceae bacterium]